MPDRPAAPELIEAVFEFLSGELLPTIDDHRLKFRTLVAMNALGIARRELEAGEEGMGEDELRDLARRIRAGDVDDGSARSPEGARRGEASRLQPRLPREVRMTRRRIYLMRHGRVAYFDQGRPLPPDDVPLTPQGREEVGAAAAVLDGIAFDRVITSGLPRTVETARIVAPGAEIESWPELREIESGGSRTSRRTSSSARSSRPGGTSSRRRRASSAASRSVRCSTG